ncbi:MAG TPA: hypothetical protein VD902_14485, partial [Symbiobacteriaceae bacterium]|nr:hypothetical protein [Symbiobacteriaceae bacterium]
MTQGEGRAPALLTIAVNSLRWVTAKLGLFLAISTVATTLIFLRAGARPVKGQYPDFAWARYWPALKQYAGHLLSGRFGPVYQPPPEAGGYPEQIPTGALVDGLVWQPLSTSLVVFGVALVLGVVTGILVGMAASRFGGRFGRRLATGTALT